MTSNPPTKRKYDSSRRKAQARETRRQIALAARGLFFMRGYSGTTIDAIAQAANVASETVYAIFSNKRNILSYLMDISIGGDEEPIHLLDRSEPQAVLHETDPRRLIMMFSNGITEILDRAAHLFEIMRSASKTEQDIEELLQHMLKERMENMTAVARQIASTGSLREGMDISMAAELIWTITSPEVFLLLTRDRNHSNEQYAAWLQATLARLLLP
jgi:TetR/AcrR family transcriptional regulator, regulator of autoinduction and epiphytic fitness